MKEVSKEINKIKKLYKNNPIFSFTVDLDWASEDAIKYCYELFEHYEIPVTFFLTHRSSFLYKHLEASNIEAGIHPNFMEGSSHGNSYTEVINYCMNLLPTIECFRSHRYYDVNDITDTFYKLGIRYDSNLCTLLQKLDPFIHRSGLLRFPIYFEDGSYLLHEKCLDFELVGKELFSSPGLMVINIHPIHLILNSPNFSFARRIKDKLTRQEWNTLTTKDFEILKYRGKGIADFLINFLQFVYKNKMQCYTLKQLYEKTKI